MSPGNTHHSWPNWQDWILILLLALPASAVLAAPVTVAVFSSSNFGAYQQSRTAFEQAVIEHLPDARFVEYLANGKEDRPDAQLQQLKKAPPALIYSLGSKATRLALSQFSDRPLISALTLNDEKVREAPNAIAVSMRIPVALQLRWLRRFLPRAKRIGMLYHPTRNGQWVEEAGKAARKLGLEWIAVPVDSPTDLPPGLKILARRADVLLGVADRVVYSRKTAKAILLSCFRNRIPFIGLSRSWVKAGALYALELDYEDVGTQSARIAVQILKGRATGDIPPAKQEKLTYAVNMKTVEHLKIRLDPALIDGASKVYE